MKRIKRAQNTFVNIRGVASVIEIDTFEKWRMRLQEIIMVGYTHPMMKIIKHTIFK